MVVKGVVNVSGTGLMGEFVWFRSGTSVGGDAGVGRRARARVRPRSRVLLAREPSRGPPALEPVQPDAYR